MFFVCLFLSPFLSCCSFFPFLWFSVLFFCFRFFSFPFFSFLFFFFLWFSFLFLLLFSCLFFSSLFVSFLWFSFLFFSFLFFSFPSFLFFDFLFFSFLFLSFRFFSFFSFPLFSFLFFSFFPLSCCCVVGPSFDPRLTLVRPSFFFPCLQLHPVPAGSHSFSYLPLRLILPVGFCQNGQHRDFRNSFAFAIKHKGRTIFQRTQTISCHKIGWSCANRMSF